MGKTFKDYSERISTGKRPSKVKTKQPNRNMNKSKFHFKQLFDETPEDEFGSQSDYQFPDTDNVTVLATEIVSCGESD